ncbi:MAG: hypothetical protein LQ345_006709 [Seirophora villosa]|nr:MAG: hypothetical protein LQ345_006709 [Seirophora villosa]
MTLTYIPEYGIVRTDHPPVVDATRWLEPHLPNETEDESAETWDLWLLGLFLTLLLLLFKSFFASLKFLLTSIRAIVARLLLAQRLELHLSPSVVDGLHNFCHYIGYRGIAHTETHVQTITRQEQELIEMAKAYVELDELYQDSDTLATSLAGQLDRLQRQHEELAQHAVVMEGQSERLTAELEDKAQEFARMERWYLDKQAHFDGDTLSIEKSMRDARDAAEEATLSAAARQSQKELLELEIERREKDAKKTRAVDAKQIKTMQKEIKELEARAVKSERQNKFDENKIEQMLRDIKDHEKEAEDFGTSLAKEMTEKDKLRAEKDELIAELAAAKKKIEEAAQWEEIPLEERIDASADKGTQTEIKPDHVTEKALDLVEQVSAMDKNGSATADKGTQTEVERDEAEEKGLQSVEQVSTVNDKDSTANTDQGTQTVVSDAKKEEKTSKQNEPVELAAALKENEELKVKIQELQKLSDERAASLQHLTVEKRQGEAAKEQAENERNLALSEKAEALAAVKSTKAQTDLALSEKAEALTASESTKAECNILWSKHSTVNVVIAWANATEVENSELRKWKSKVELENQDFKQSQADSKKAIDSLKESETRLKVENSDLKTMKEELELKCKKVEGEIAGAFHSRDEALQQFAGLQTQYQQDLKSCEDNEAEMRKEAQQFEANKNLEVQTLQNNNVSLQRQVRGLEAELTNGTHFKAFQAQKIDELQKQLRKAEAVLETRDASIQELKRSASAPRPPAQRKPGRATQQQYDNLVAGHEELKKELKTCEAKLQQANAFDRYSWTRNEQGKWLAEKKKFVQRIEELEKQLNGSRANNQPFQDIAQKHKEQCSAMEEQVKGLNAKIIETQKQLDNLNIEVVRMRNEKNALDGKIKELTDHKQKLLKEVIKQESECKNAEKRHRDREEEDDDEGGASPMNKQQKKREYDD